VSYNSSVFCTNQLYTDSGKLFKHPLSVQDSGIGIAPADLGHIFERFYRADKARQRDSGGAGLGLSIAQWIAAAHQARIHVESTPAAGSSFSVRFFKRGHRSS
jgi:signal transduction histidine kinase